MEKLLFLKLPKSTDSVLGGIFFNQTGQLEIVAKDPQVQQELSALISRISTEHPELSIKGCEEIRETDPTDPSKEKVTLRHFMQKVPCTDPKYLEGLFDFFWRPHGHLHSSRT